jgi:LytR cell envelope-related transcriptional attenuator
VRKPGRWIVLGLVFFGLGWWMVMRDGAPTGTERSETAERARPVDRVVRAGTRIRVEVLNGTGQRGLARRGTTAMRDAGFDVVSTGNWPERADSSLVLVRTGNEAWGKLAVRALGEARLELRPDSSRYVDLTIVLGTRWRPPPLPLDP